MATAQSFLIDPLIPRGTFADPDQRHRARVLILGIVVGGACALACLFAALLLDVPITPAQAGLVFLPHLASYPLWRMSGSLELACYAFIGAITVAIVSLISWGYLIASMGCILLPMTAAHIAGTKAGVVWTVICVAICGVWIPLAFALSPADSLMVYLSGILALTAGISSIAVEQFRIRSNKAFNSVKQSLAMERMRTRETLIGAFPVVLEVVEGKIQYLTEDSAALFGYAKEKLIGLPLDDVMHPADFNALNARRHDDVSERVPVEIRVRHYEGHWLWLSVYLIFSAPADEEDNFWTMAGHDVSEEKSQQAKLIQAQRLESIGVLAAGLAHDFNNMLTVIGGYADLLEQGEVKERISGTVDDAAILVQKLMAFGRNQQFVSEQADVVDVLHGMQAVLVSVLGPGIQLEIEVEPQPCSVGLSATQLNQIFLNLAANAKDAMGDKGVLRIEVREAADAAELRELKPGRYVCISVSDNGAGMDTETLQYVFDPFFTTKEHKIGAGLGLSSVYGIVKGGGGVATIQSESGFGTKVSLFVPMREADQVVEVELPNVTSSRHGRGSILVVEDDQLIADLTARNLVAEGFNVTIKHDVGSAWAQLQEALPDLLVTDIMMPDGRGTELAQRLRANTIDIPILFISGYSDQEIGEWKDAEGEIRFLAKPFRRKDLINRVNELIGAPVRTVASSDAAHRGR